jgi:peptidoglycan/xylan/chitin deacetylase (PgdA/CDA1 family)
MFSKGLFCISLDFELHWGGVEKRSLPAYNKYFLSTREVIPQILELFTQYNIHTSWATVGILFHDSADSFLKNAPTSKPSYINDNLSTYNYIDKNPLGYSELEDPFHFAPSLIQLILSAPNQELASHTFSHYYCNEPGQTASQFREDLKAAQRVAQNFGVVLKSLVFPRNQFRDEYLKICFEEGITSVRSNPADWFWDINNDALDTLPKKIFRTADAYLPLSKTCFSLNDLNSKKDFPLSIPASRFLRPYSPKEYFLHKLKINRICAEMELAAKENKVYHLWWHPHNFGGNPLQNILGLKKILNTYKRLQIDYGMQSANMAEIATTILNQNVFND